MTVIATDMHTLAADTLCTTRDGAIIYGDKIWRTPMGFYGGCGDDNAVELVRKWIMAGGSNKTKPTLWQDADFTGLLIRKNGEIWIIDPALVPVPYHPQKFAIGSGGPAALAYMKEGKTAEEAVRLVIAGGWDGCGGQVQTLALRAKKGIRRRSLPT